MIDPKIIRENPENVRKNLEKRRDPSIIAKLDSWVSSDKEWRELKQKTDDLRAKRNTVTESIKQAKMKGENTDALMAEAKTLPELIKASEAKLKELEVSNKALLMNIPNILQDDVPYGKDGDDNVVIRTWGEAVKNPNLVHHGQLAVKLNVAEFDRAVKISGEGFYALKGDLALLNMAIVAYSIELLSKKGFSLVIPPAMMNRKSYEGVTDLSDFESVMYKIENEDHYMIATAEHPLTSMLMDETLEEKDLPIVQAGYSTNFRKEIGKHGLDERGLFRLHQFDKVEQIVFCRSEDSNMWHEKMVENAEELCKDFEIPHRVVLICTGDIGTVAAKKYDIECWSPREGKYFETHSLSNCTTYQATRLNIKYKKSATEKEFVHTLNATQVAIPRMLRAIIENHQTPQETIKIPKALVKYMMGKTEIKA
ncbi:MAG: serine--tRNA ligase [Candidatus ainarchaeum sp.]|nr:serine--tRNA ligase [Candidatus ainarchaeum sp.]